MFQILHRDGLSRIGELEIKNKKIVTPVLLPVLHPFKTDPWISAIKQMKLGGVITNSYILKKGGFQKGKDIHDLLDFGGIVMTDSGTFQEHMYGELNAANLEMVKYQAGINSDIITIRDIFSEMDHSKGKIEEDIKENYNRGREAIAETGEYIALPIQGGIYPDLRQESARLMGSLDSEYFPIGGIVPFMERYMYSMVLESILNSKRNLRSSGVIHAFGAGHPMFFPLLFLVGVDVIDSSAYIKYARDGRILTETGTVELKSYTEELPPSPYFDKYTAKELSSLGKDEQTEVIGLHNLYVSVKELENIRQQIRSENMWNYAEYRAHSHPLLLEALRKVHEFYDYTEKFEPLSRRTPIFYSGEETLDRPNIKRFISRIGENPTGIKVDKKPYSYYVDTPVDYVQSQFGVVSLLLDETYPVAQSLFPGEYYDSYKDVSKFDKPEWQEFLLNKVDYIFNYQFGKKLYSMVDKRGITLQRSKNTGKIRNVYSGGKQILSLRASDGLFSLNYEGAVLIHSNFEYPAHRVVIDPEVTEFIREGRNVFAKFVEEADPGIRPHDEVVIVDRDDKLLSYGRVILNRQEMIEFRKGIAVKNRLKSDDSS
ncbi:MAG: tRNA guanosine(15) transglycosylase TgtA [Thermoplasmatales archaeon]|nr:tRNA guanosine(15) transglycosylase TgtA [Candidatus Thermoplasmatota archaeon]MCL6002763.1 tRNA guanosine(15) transglycosylase TgtA [Candidatus Thermoplasmatota archaeon]MDA8056162.1 tRNA guanosine(15) transglycosylase TgtA [Thermoplasmatales archaeon]